MWLMSGTQAIVVGGSAGALDALNQILPALPAGFSIPVVLVLHVHPTKPSYLARLLGDRCALTVKEAEDKEPLAPATLYVAPPNYHLLVEPRRCLSLSVDEPVLFSRPAIDVLFESAADVYGPALAGVILTGASSDGACGLRAVHARGGRAFVQDPATAAASIMPAAALLAVPEARVSSIAGLLSELCALETAR
jgi:two-component system chemotaxis response regulator CheB